VLARHSPSQSQCRDHFGANHNHVDQIGKH
jgi:hypothetical protein